MTNKSALQTVAIAAALGGLAEAPSHISAPKREQSDFVKRSNFFKSLCRPRVFYPASGRPYVKPPVEGEVKGKLAIKAAKRERVKALKAAR